MSKKKLGLVLGFVLVLATFLSAQQFKLLHSFAGAPSGGSSPSGSLIQGGTALFGMTYNGGMTDNGTIFKINRDGTGFQVLHSFAGGASDGKNPLGSLILSGSTLYGMTRFGGTSDRGTIFKILVGGKEFEVLHSFGIGDSDGEDPTRSLVLNGSTLYGMTFYGGMNDDGTIFKINTNGTGYSVIYSFGQAYNTDGSNPAGSLILSGSTLYGMTRYGGINNTGTVFKINCDGTGYAVLLNFEYSPKGAHPTGSLVLGGSTLYGMTWGGGDNDYGMIFKIDTNGTNYARIRSFAHETSNGQEPWGSLILSGSTLYGMTQLGGTINGGTIFQIKTDGTGFALLHSFAAGLSDGIRPLGDLFLMGGVLYGMTNEGGAHDHGIVFSYQLYADIGLTKSSDNITPQQGSEFVFTITAKNNGPNDATGLWVRDQLPTGLTYVSSNPSTGTYNSSTGSWSIGPLARDATATLALRVKAGSTLGIVKNTASSGGANEFDPNSANDSASQVVTIRNATLLAPVLLEPTNSATGQPTTVTLKWQDTNSSPQELKYKVRIKKAGGTYTKYTVAANSISYIKSGLARGKTYYWSVQAIGNGTSIRNSAWPADFRFTTAQ